MKIRNLPALLLLTFLFACKKNDIENKSSETISAKPDLGAAGATITSSFAFSAIPIPGQTLFQSGFQNGTTLVRGIGGNTQFDDITGVDGSYNWQSSLETAHPYFTDFRINYQYGAPVDRYVDLVTDPNNPNGTNRVLRFFILNAKCPEEDQPGVYKGRIQAQLENLTPGNAKVKEYYQKVKILFDYNAFTRLKNSTYPTEAEYLTMFETGDELAGTAKRYRISLNIVNKNHKLYWQVSAQQGNPFVSNTETNGGIGRQTLDNYEIPINNTWVTMQIYIKQAYNNVKTASNTGQFVLAMNYSTIYEFKGRTCADANTTPDGMESWNPMKLYCSDNVLNTVNTTSTPKLPFKVYWDDLDIRYSNP